MRLKGGVQYPNAESLLNGFEVTYDSKIDTTIDPTSDKYRDQQIKLYQEISGRALSQIENEQAEVPDNADFCNPYASRYIRFIQRKRLTNPIFFALFRCDRVAPVNILE